MADRCFPGRFDHSGNDISKMTLDLALALPAIPDGQDACVQRLTKLLKAKGLTQAHLIRENATARLCLHYNPEQFNVAQVRHLAQTAGAKIGHRYRHEILRIDGMDCPTCAEVIEHALGRMKGVLEAEVSYGAERLRLEYDIQRTTGAAIKRRIQALGYGITEKGHKTSGWVEHREIILSFTAGVLLLIGWLLNFTTVPQTVPLSCFIGAYLAGGIYISREVWQGLRRGCYNIDILMIIAAAGAAVLGAWAEGALLLFLFSLGHALEHRAMDRARHAIEALAELAPRTALVRRDQTEIEIQVEELQRGDQIIIKPGQHIPADGQIRVGRSTIDQSPITGESVPFDKQPGDIVFAGTINGESALIVEVTKLTRESTLARMVELVTEAQTQHSPTQRLTHRLEKIFVPAVLAGAGLMMWIPPLFGLLPMSESFYRAIAMVVAASPCALAIATPSAILSGIACAARSGVLIKGGAHLENLGALTAMAFDKTGTLTHGQLNLTNIVVLQGTEEALLSTAAAVENRSSHPLAQAIVAAARKRGIQWREVEALEAIAGQGVRAKLAEQPVAIGNLRLFGTESIPDEVRQQITQLEAAGKTTMVVQIGGRFLGVLGLADRPRKGARTMLNRLAQLGIRKTILLTGDNKCVGQAIGEAVGLSEVQAGLMPEDKVMVIEALLQRYQRVAMVGDGVNDAPALARATVGIAMGGASTQVALEAADVVLMADDLSKLPFAVGLSHATRRIIRQNLWLSLGVAALLIPATLSGLAGIAPAVIAHEGSTLVVVLNALRLLGYREGAKHKFKFESNKHSTINPILKPLSPLKKRQK